MRTNITIWDVILVAALAVGTGFALALVAAPWLLTLLD